MDVFATVRDIIVEIKDVPADTVKLESHFEEDLEADSLDIVEMLMLLEEKFELQIPEEVAEKLKTVSDAVDYIQAQVAEKE
ncbi:acyl carrier protein [Syntrophomonas erecta]